MQRRMCGRKLSSGNAAKASSTGTKSQSNGNILCVSWAFFKEMIVIIGISRFHVRNFFSLVPMNLPAVVVTMVAVLQADLRAEIRG